MILFYNSKFFLLQTNEQMSDILCMCVFKCHLRFPLTSFFSGRYAFHLWKPLGQAITETAKKISTSSLSLYYKGGFEQKMSRREASLILGVSPSADKAKIRAAHRRIMILNHPDKAVLLGYELTL
uniref:DnaJ heat shock protein family (Hsp40) member C15 n=1 Tax=Meleagris gallopavo TaxID=9103 RepID=A0A803YG34_MELGA